MEILQCPKCADGMTFAVIDIDGRNLEEGHECPSCSCQYFGGTHEPKVSRFNEDDEFIVSGVTLTVLEATEKESYVDLDGEREMMPNKELFQWIKDSNKETAIA